MSASKAVGLFLYAVLVSGGLVAADVRVDFRHPIGKIRPALHSSGYAPLSVSAGKTMENVKAMNFDYVRTHDLALVNPGQRVVDSHFIFPLMHLDAGDPSNYYFKATDHLLALSRKAGLKIFYRLGTSIEHTGLVHFNAEIPQDFDKLAETFAGTVRHYNRGWADGYHWNIRYWEIWNEPDGCNNMWSFNGEDDTAGHFANQPQRMRHFREFFVTCLRRLKSEFPDIKVGGPAFCSYNEHQIRPFLQDCKESGVAPDFLSWHCYTRDPNEIISAADKARRLCDSFGFMNTELVIDEWHYLFPGGWGAIRSSDPEVQKQVQFAPDGQNGIDSACFTLSTLAQLQTSKYDQAYFYGCMHQGNWGYLDALGKPNKNYFACSAFGRIMGECTDLCAVETQTNSPVALAACDDASGRKLLLVIDYGGRFGRLDVDIRGVPEESSASMFVLSHEKDLEKQDVQLSGGRLSLEKPLGESAAYLIQFEEKVKTTDLQSVCQRLVDEAVASGEQGGVQFCAYKDGKCIVDVWAGSLSTNAGAAKVDGRTLFPIFSTEKPLLATAVHRAVERGLMDYDKPLCTWWPEFMGDGKEKLTLGLTLGYRSGMPAKLDPTVFPTVEDQCDWSRICKWAAAVKPELEPGTKQRYMSLSYGWYLGHPLEVACGKPLKDCLDELVLEPAGITDDFFFATNEGCESRIATFYGSASVERMNDRRRWRFCLPSAYAVANARSVARFYNRLCGFDGKAPLIRKETLDNALKPCRHPSDPLPDAETMKDKWFMIFGMGYGLWGEAERMDRVFGHGGAGGSEGLVDRDNRLVVAYTCNFDNNKGGLRQRLYDAVGMKWRYWKDKKADIQTLQMKTVKGK